MSITENIKIRKYCLSKKKKIPIADLTGGFSTLFEKDSRDFGNSVLFLMGQEDDASLCSDNLAKVFRHKLCIHLNFTALHKVLQLNMT